MKAYLVGGAVRDELLGRPVKDRDWVVVGATSSEMLSMGFDQVGADFPVFLHPTTKEEYALARTERKVAAGYHGFETDFNPSVTLEEDLVRRDLTMNAMARLDEDGELIDPFGGQQDLEDKVLRHVSEAFAEDPVRVLRVARFRARYNFSVAPETMVLMKDLVEAGELDTLVPERVWAEMEKALMEDHPSLFFKTLEECGALDRVMPGLVLTSLSALDRAATENASLDQRVMVLMAHTPRVKAKLLSVRAPTKTTALAVKFKRLLAELQQDVDVDSAWKLVKELDFLRQSQDLMLMALPFHCFNATLGRLDTVITVANVARKVTFASLTPEQQETLKGAKVGKAIDALRVERLSLL